MSRLAAVLVLVPAAILAAGLPAACASSTGAPGGPETPIPVPIIAYPSARPVGNTVPTSVVVGGRELVLYFWGDPARPTLTAAWRDTGTGAVDVNTGCNGVIVMDPDELRGHFFGLRQCVTDNGSLIEFGAIWAEPARITSKDAGKAVDARFAWWSGNHDVTVFWLKRAGAPVPDNTPDGEGRTAPLPEDRYPILTAYDAKGRTITTARIRPSADEQKGG
jgi:hypothetical protein